MPTLFLLKSISAGDNASPVRAFGLSFGDDWEGWN